MRRHWPTLTRAGAATTAMWTVAAAKTQLQLCCAPPRLAHVLTSLVARVCHSLLHGLSLLLLMLHTLEWRPLCFAAPKAKDGTQLCNPSCEALEGHECGEYDSRAGDTAEQLRVSVISCLLHCNVSALRCCWCRSQQAHGPEQAEELLGLIVDSLHAACIAPCPRPRPAVGPTASLAGSRPSRQQERLGTSPMRRRPHSAKEIAKVLEACGGLAYQGRLLALGAPIGGCRGAPRGGASAAGALASARGPAHDATAGMRCRLALAHIWTCRLLEQGTCATTSRMCTCVVNAITNISIAGLRVEAPNG